MAYAFPSGFNTFVPSWEATGQVISFIRNPRKFKINEYAAFRPATKPVGLFLEFDLDSPARSLSLDQMVWPVGNERPTGEGNMGGFAFNQYRTIRRDIPVTLARRIISQTDWPILALNSSMAMAQAMTALTRLTIDELDTAGNWGAYTVTAATAGAGTGLLNGSNATAGDADYLNIMKVFNYAKKTINLNTNGMVQADQIVAVIPVEVAEAMRESAELVDVIKQSPYAMAQVRGDVDNPNVMFGLPATLYGIKLVVEDAVFIDAVKGATQTRARVFATDDIIFMSKQDVLPGDQVGDAPTPNFSTYQVFYYSGEGSEGASPRDNASGLLTVKTWDDIRNERTEVHINFETSETLVNPNSGLLVTGVLA